MFQYIYYIIYIDNGYKPRILEKVNTLNVHQKDALIKINNKVVNSLSRISSIFLKHQAQFNN